MRDRQVQIFDNLHVITRDDYADVAQGLHLPALEASDADRFSPGLSGHPKSIQHILGISASAYAERNILRHHKIS